MDVTKVLIEFSKEETVDENVTNNKATNETE